MCGICGIIGQTSSIKLERMLNVISYRGPDETTFFHGNVCSIGVNRLKIKGNAENKIKFNIFGREVIIVLNGEIYNYKSLFALYSKNTNYQFETDLELELLALMYVIDGDLFINKIDGMFSIAIYESKRLILYRDKVGIKPLYYVRNDRVLIFSSEIKSIVIVDEKSHGINRSVLIEQLLLSFSISDNETILEDIYQVPPGGYLIFESNNIFLKKYYCFSPMEVSSNIKENILIAENLLEDSIYKVFRHDDLEKGLLLSGGLDSSLIALKAHDLSLPFSAYTLGPKNIRNFEDVSYAKKLAGNLGFNHEVMYVDEDQAINSLIQFTYFYENIDFEGFFSPYGGLAFYLMAKNLSSYPGVIVSGDGADELFAGYQHLHCMPLKAFGKLHDRASKIHDGSGYKEYFLSSLNRKIVSSDDASLLYDLLISAGIYNFHLPCLDKCTSCFSMELRPIYLDINLYEYIRSIDLSQKMHQGINKYILQKISEKHLRPMGLNKLLNRKKMAMPSVLDNIVGSIDDRLKRLYSGSNQAHNKYSGLFYTTEQRVLFDLFYYIFVYKKCDINIKEEMLLSNVINPKEFNDMYD